MVLCALYLFDKVVCFIYCTLKSRKKKVVLEENNVDIQNQSTRYGLIQKIKDLLMGWMMYSVMRLGRCPFQKYRLFILRHIYRMQIGKNVVIYGGFKIRAPWNIAIGNGTVIGDGCQLDGRNGLVIGKNVNLSSDVYIYTEQHDINDPYFASNMSGGKVVVGDRAWLSSRTTVLPNVNIGEGAVLASAALANKDLEPFSIYAGIPAKKIGDRNKNLIYDFNGSYFPFY